MNRVRPIHATAAAAVAGIACADRFPMALAVWFALATLTAVLALLPHRHRFFCALLATFCLCGAGLSVRRERRHPPRPGPAEMTGVVVGPPRHVRGRWSYPLQTDSFLLQVFQQEGVSPGWGDRVRLRGNITLPEPVTNPGQFDYRRHLFRKGITGVLRTSGSVEILEPCARNATRMAAALRTAVASASERRLPESVHGLLAGIVLSITDDIPFELHEAFEATGTVHLLSTSGLHLATLASVVAFLLAGSPARTRSVAIIGLCWCVALASGAGPAPVRSAVMATVAAAAPIFRRRSDPAHALSAAVLVAGACDPEALFDVGAQLSFAAVLTLIACGPWFTAVLRLDDPFAGWRTRVTRKLAAALFLSAVVHGSTAPIVAYHLHRFSVLAPVANVPIAFLGEGALVVGAAAVIVDPVPLVGDAAWFALRPLLGAIVIFAEVGGDQVDADLPCAAPPVWVPIAVLCGIVAGGSAFSRSATRRRVFTA